MDGRAGVIALDTNILIYLLVKNQPEHKKALAWLGSTTQSLATTSINLGEVFRLLTHPKVFKNPLKLPAAIDLVGQFMVASDIRLLTENEDWVMDLKSLAKNLSISGNEVFDARIALILKFHGISKICTLDRNFLKFPFLQMVKI